LINCEILDADFFPHILFASLNSFFSVQHRQCHVSVIICFSFRICNFLLEVFCLSFCLSAFYSLWNYLHFIFLSQYYFKFLWHHHYSFIRFSDFISVPNLFLIILEKFSHPFKPDFSPYILIDKLRCQEKTTSHYFRLGSLFL